ncbi:MAG: hypothetical protein FGM37_01610 [Phycisphaerales bacterium]|nr:hypothetical protein [Phycisphaerales bacterium]
MLTLPARAAAHAAVLALSCALALCVVAPRVACAQGTSGAIPDPMSVGELKLLLEQRADLPPGVWPQIQAAHDAYARRAEEFRDGDVERFQKRFRSMATAEDLQAQLAQWQATMREYSELARKLDTIDEGLFADVAKVLAASPDAVAAVESAKLARRRQALRMGMGRATMSPSTSADVEQVAFDVGIPDAARAGVRQALAGYGAKQSPALRDFGDRMQQVYIEFVKVQMAALQVPAGDGEGARSGGMAADEAATEAVWARLGPEVTRQRKQLLANNRAAARAVIEALEQYPDAQQRFMDRWIVESYPAIPDSESTGVPQAGRRALRLKSIDDAARESLRLAIAEWRAADGAIVEEWSTATDDFDSAQIPLSFGQEAFGAFNELVVELQRRRTERAAQALKAIEAVVGSEASAIVRGTDFSRDDELLAPEQADPEAAAQGAAQTGDRLELAREHFLREHGQRLASWSRPLGPEDVARVAAALAADAGQRSVIETLAADHASGWVSRIDPIFAESRTRIERSLVDDGDGISAVEEWPKSVEAAGGIRDALDAEFFDGLAAVTAGTGGERVVGALRQLRTIDGAVRDDAALVSRQMGARPSGWRIDPLEGVWQSVAPERREDLVAMLVAALPAMLQSADAARVAARGVSEVEQQVQRLGAESPEAERMAAFQRMTDIWSQRTKASEALRAAEDALAQGALALLAEDARARVRLERTRRQNPQYFRDDPVKRAYDRALALDGLDDAVRTAITAALTEYLSARDASEGTLVEAVGVRPEYPVFDPESPESEARFAKQYEAWMLANEKVERMLYIRRSGRERALLALSSILGPDRMRAAQVPDAAALAREEARRNAGEDVDSGE